MVSAIGSSLSSGSPTAGIEAQVIRYKKELSDCVNCASADTTAGKAAITEAATKVSIAEARIESIAAANQDSKVDAPTTATDSTTKKYDGALTYERTAGAESGAALTLSAEPAGSRVDLFA